MSAHTDHAQEKPATPGPKPAATNGKTFLFGAIAIIGAMGCPPLAVFFAFASWREPKKTREATVVAQVALVLAGVSVVVYSLLFAGGKLPFTGWLIPDQ